jgi:uncharacterized damage-inducible protein DinB
MNTAYFRRMIDYTYWAHRLVWGCILELSEEQYRHPSDFSIGSVHDQVVHTMSVEWLWLQRVRGEAVDGQFAPQDFLTRDSVRARWNQIDAAWHKYAATLTDAQLDETIAYTSIHGNITRRQPRWEGLATTVNHATDHRAQTMAVIHWLGGRTVEQDFILYSWAYPAEPLA